MEEDAGAGEQLAKVLRPLVGVTVTQSLTTRGEVEEVKIPDSVFEKISSNPVAKKILSRDAIKSLFSQANVLLPEGNVDKGDTWEQEKNLTTGLGNAMAKQTYTYGGKVEAGETELDRIDVVTQFDAASIKNPLGGKIAVSDAKGKGEILFDAAAGRLQSSKGEQSMTSKLELFGQEIVQEMQVTSSTTLKPLPAGSATLKAD